jgi:hypothetical protein
MSAFHFGAGWEINEFERNGSPPLHSDDDGLIILLGFSEVSREEPTILEGLAFV